jgi:hypothetical protein
MNKHNWLKALFFLSACFILSCGRVIIDDPIPEIAPPSITAINDLGNSRIKIEWFFSTYEEPLIKGFRLERSENNGDFRVITDSIPKSQRSIELAETFRGGRVSFRLSSKTADGILPVVASYFMASTPSNIFCNALSTTLIEGINKPNVYLYWKPEANSVNYSGNYLVQRSSKGQAFQTIATVKTRYFSDTNVVSDETYKYLVKLATTNCASNESPMTVSKLLGLCPQNFKLKQLSDKNNKSVLLTWDAQLADFALFYVKRAESVDGIFENITPKGIRTTVFEDKSALKANSSYFYKISAQINSQPPNNCETEAANIKIY